MLARAALCTAFLMSPSFSHEATPTGSCPRIALKIAGDGTVIWNDVPQANRVQFESRLLETSHQTPRPGIDFIVGANSLKYVGQTQTLFRKYHFRIAFVLKPTPWMGGR